MVKKISPDNVQMGHQETQLHHNCFENSQQSEQEGPEVEEIPPNITRRYNKLYTSV
jgi:hypothetical protein